jgi:hypothetical protein
MARRKASTLFTEATGKNVNSIKYEENADWQPLEVVFSDETLFCFEFNSRVTVPCGPPQILRESQRCDNFVLNF